MAASSPITSSQAYTIKHDYEANREDDYVIVGTFNHKIFEKYDELLIKVNEILNRVYLKTSTK